MKSAITPVLALSDEIQQYCQQKGIKLTPLREKILLILKQSKEPLTAYAVLERLQVDKPKARVMSVYRILDFLRTHGLIHRIENLNAFMPCCHLFEKHLSQWLICKQCGQADEWALPIFKEGLKEIEAKAGFDVSIPTIELLGVCKACQNQAEQL